MDMESVDRAMAAWSRSSHEGANLHVAAPKYMVSFARATCKLKGNAMHSAPILTLYTFINKSAVGEDRWRETGIPEIFYEDVDEARRDMLEVHEEHSSGPDTFPLCLEKVETIPMTKSAIMALLNHGVKAIIDRYEIIEEFGGA
ncbi:hypothetical protein B5K03_09145 [Rhizobium phaseoli]|uniref:hypothetical protein n=1 Tax=Rhizobium phaseoli TaxID=396 RepID=UPI000D6839C9|nr:hypothetical protein [Rhizobium phaseoli]PWI54352.1 hypothetical protein B5K03_09145 [Rhizobium phaseoli]